MTAKRLHDRARIISQVRRFFASREFLEVETPILVPSPGLDLHLDAFEVTAKTSARYLITSPEYQMKRLLADGYSRIFQVTKCFRHGEIGSRHNPEFTMLEWYRANADVHSVMRDTEELVAEVTGGNVHVDGHNFRCTPPFERLTVIDAFARFASVSEADVLDWAAHDEDRYFRVLVEKVEPGIEKIDHAVFLTEYPATQASLARKKPEDPRVAERFELYVAGVELCNGFGELTDPVEQRARLLHDQAERAEKKLPIYPIDEKFLQALERGIPASGGNALGLDRLIALACGTTNIEQVMAFVVGEL